MSYDQLGLYDGTPPHQKHSDTSEAAAKSIARKVNQLHRRLLARLHSVGSEGLTDAEMQEDLEMAGNTQRPRRIELVEMGRVKDSGHRRRGPSGRKATVWVLV